MNGFLSTVKAVRDYALGVVRGVCGAAGALASELPPGRVRSVAELVTEACGSLGLMPEAKPAPPADAGAAAHAAAVPELHAAVVRGAAGEAAGE
jgi:hypothetical protein